MKKIIKSYINLLNALDLKDPIIYKGIREGLNKFLSNAYLAGPGHKYEKGHYYSQKAYEKVKNRDWSNLIFEHMIPKQKYIQKPCVDMAIKDELDEEKVNRLINDYWQIAIITKEENNLLSSKSMPKGWDEKDIFYRYKKVGLILINKNDLNW